MVFLAAALAAVMVAAGAASAGELEQTKTRARELATEVSALDARIDAAVLEVGRATSALTSLREQIRDNRRRRRVVHAELEFARAVLQQRAVVLYKRGQVTSLDAMLGADDFSELVEGVSLLRTVVRSDTDLLRTVERTRRELRRTADRLESAARAAERLVERRAAGLQAIRRQLAQRQELLRGVRDDLRTLAAERQQATSPSPAPTVEPPEADGSGPWWPLIREAAQANGVSARGLYRLMMIESGGSATVVGPGGYHGLFQYSLATWKGAWNPWRSQSVYDGDAQISATALAIAQGKGPSWWGGSYAWAFN
jgi:peptidoglycan hydrolase CwlO-like protein